MEILNFKKYHLIGVGGIGISAIAKMLILRGKKVTGSDASKSEITEELERMGVKIFIGQKVGNLTKDTEAVIYSVAIKEDNPEMAGARKKELRCFSYPQFLGELSQKMFTIAISGTHGKTTTTAMLGHIMRKAGLDPTIIVGSKMLDLENSNFHAGQSDYLVVEACEYKRSFLNLRPKILVITNIDADHLDYYKNLEDIKSAFEELRSRVTSGGKIITETDYKKISADFNLLVPGRHNILNAQAAIAAAVTLGVSEKQAKEVLKTFSGTWRRLECKGEKDGKIFYDDYAHHPAEITASLSALHEKHPDREIVCVFEPHQASRTKFLFHDFVSALRTAGWVFVAPIFVTREMPDYSVSNKILAEAVNKFIPALAVENTADLKKEIEKINHKKLLCIVFMGAGNIYKWTGEFLS